MTILESRLFACFVVIAAAASHQEGNKQLNINGYQTIVMHIAQQSEGRTRIIKLSITSSWGQK